MNNRPIIFSNDKAYSLNDLGPIADMPLQEGLQAIIDNGFMGDDLRGTPWYNVFTIDLFDVQKVYDSTDIEPVATMRDRYVEKVKQYEEAVEANQDASELFKEVMYARKSWQASKKLSTP